MGKQSLGVSEQAAGRRTKSQHNVAAEQVALAAEQGVLAAEQGVRAVEQGVLDTEHCLLYTSPSPRDKPRSRMPSSA